MLSGKSLLFQGRYELKHVDNQHGRFILRAVQNVQLQLDGCHAAADLLLSRGNELLIGFLVHLHIC